jgi:hypothetical protein
VERDVADVTGWYGETSSVGIRIIPAPGDRLIFVFIWEVGRELRSSGASVIDRSDVRRTLREPGAITI